MEERGALPGLSVGGMGSTRGTWGTVSLLLSLCAGLVSGELLNSRGLPRARVMLQDIGVPLQVVVPAKPQSVMQGCVPEPAVAQPEASSTGHISALSTVALNTL